MRGSPFYPAPLKKKDITILGRGDQNPPSQPILMMSCTILNVQRKLFYTDVNVQLQPPKRDTATQGLKQAGSGLAA